MRPVILCAAALLLLGLPAATLAQETSPRVMTVHELVLNDGSRVYGAIEQETDDEVVFRTTAGATLRAARAQVVSLRPVSGRMVRGEFRREDPNNTRLLFAPTARAIPKGQVYLGVYEVVVPFVQVGITDRLSFGGGTPLIFEADWDRLYWITPKLQVFTNGRTHAAVGLFHGFSRNDGAGIAYGVVTHEAGPGAITVGAGMGYTSDGGRAGVVMAGAEAGVRRNLKVITENYLFDGAAITSGGFRFFGERLSADLALGIALTDDGAFGFPIVNFVYRF